MRTFDYASRAVNSGSSGDIVNSNEVFGPAAVH